MGVQALLLVLVQMVGGAAGSAASHRDLPFAPGEVLTYDARVSLFGKVGEATLRVDRSCVAEDRPALLLSFDVAGGASFMRVEDETRSWIDATTLSTLRYRKRESSPLGSHEESVHVDSDGQTWRDTDGRLYQTASPLPLDELSLLYFVRTLPLEPGDSELGVGHFDSRRNPVELKVRGRTEVDVPAGRFAVIDIELRVRDPRRYRGTGSIRIYLTDDHRRIPVRIRTALPGSAPVTLDLRTADAARPDSALECPWGFS